MTGALLLSQVPGTLLFFAVVLIGAVACFLLGQRVEQDDLSRRVRAGELVIIPDDVREFEAWLRQNLAHVADFIDEAAP